MLLDFVENSFLALPGNQFPVQGWGLGWGGATGGNTQLI